MIIKLSYIQAIIKRLATFLQDCANGAGYALKH